MHRSVISVHWMIGLALLTITGCHSYNPYGYGPYGYGNQPGYQTFPPVGGGSVPGTVPRGSGAYLSPNDFSAKQATVPRSPSYFVQPWQRFEKSIGAEPQPATGESFRQPTTDKRVPDYPADADAPFSDSSGQEFTSPSESSSSTGVQLQGIQAMARADAPIAAGASGPVFLGEPLSADELNERGIEDDVFSSPVPLKPVSSSRTVEGRADESSVKRPNPYAYDRNNHSWLRGVVDYDEQDKSWHLIYDLTPDSQDEYGGDITLIDDTRLDFIQNDDVVLVEGRIDSSIRDSFGKPCYRVKKIDRLVPKASN